MPGIKSAKARALMAALVALRQETGRTQRAFAENVGINQATWARYETGDRTPSEETLLAVFDKLGTSDGRRAEILATIRGTQDPQWLATTLPEQRAQLAALLDFERTATAITDVSPLVIPGLLQTREYMERIMADGGVPAEDRSTRTAVRIGRREVITRPDAAQYRVYLGQAALHHSFGDRVMVGHQLRHMIRMTDELSNLTLHVVPFDSPWHPGLEGAFSLVENPQGPVVHLELRDTTLFFHERAAVDRYMSAVYKVSAAALSPEHSLALIEEVAEQMERET